jgi:flagellar biosynthetic protein FliO
MFRTFIQSILVTAVLVFTGTVAMGQKEQQKSEPVAASPTSPTPNTSTENANAQPAASPQSQPDSANNERLPFMNQTDTDSQESTPGVAGLLLRTVGALLLIVGLIVAVSWGMKRFAGARFGAPKEDAPQLALLNSLSLGDKRSLAVIRFGSRTLLVGSTAQNVTLLAEDEIDDFATTPRSVADFLNDEQPVEFQQPLEFAEQLANATGQLTERLDIGGRQV